MDEKLGWHLGKRGGYACWERPAVHAACTPGQEEDLCEGGREINREERGQISQRSESHTEQAGLYPIRRREQLEPVKSRLT